MPFPAGLLYILVVLVIVGLGLWVLDQIPIDATIKRIIRVIVIVLVCLWLLWWLISLFPYGGLVPPRR